MSSEKPYSTPLVGGPVDGGEWRSAVPNREDDRLVFTAGKLQAVYYFQGNYQGRGPQFVYFRTQLPIRPMHRP